MKQIVILGGGTAGLIVANRLAKQKNKLDIKITIIDKDEDHYYQPGFLLYPFGYYKKSDILHQRSKYLPGSVQYIQSTVSNIDAKNKKIELSNKTSIDYDILVVATGSRIAPEMTPGMLGDNWHKNIHEFYTFEGAEALRSYLASWQGGTLVVNITEMPIKCPVAPLEFVFLTDWYLKKRGLREKTTLKFVTPLSGAFTKPKASESLGHLLKERNIEIVPDFGLEKIENNFLISYDERKVEFDGLVTIPINAGDEVIIKSGLGDELGFVPTDHHTLQSKNYPDVFVIGDAANVPASKAGSVAHFEADTIIENITRYIKGQELEASFDGHANCFVEMGNKKALLIDFNYEVEPLEGRFPFPVLGPLSLLKPSRINHIGKLAFRLIYWNILIKGFPLPGIPVKMSLKGKIIDKES